MRGQPLSWSYRELFGPLAPAEALNDAELEAQFAVIEERQTQTILAQDRIAMTLDRLSLRLDSHEKSCLAQEKELRALIADTAKDLSQRIDELEKSEPLQEQTSKWMMAAVWGAAGLLAMIVAKQLWLV